MLIYAQNYAGITGSGLCCAGPVSIFDVAHLSRIKRNTVRQLRQEVRKLSFQNKMVKLVDEWSASV